MRGFKSAVKKIWDFICLLTGDDVSIYAAQASFFLVISAIPFLMLIFAILKLFINIDLSSVMRTISAFAPPQISIFLSTIINELFSKSSSVSVISVTAVSTLWLSSKGVMALYTGLNKVYHSPEKNYFYNRIVSVVYTLLFIVAIVLTIVVFGFGGKIQEFVSGRWVFLSVIIDLFLRVRILIFLVYLTFVFALFYKFLPKNGSSFKAQLPGAALAAGGWMGFSYIYSVYIENFSNYSYVYGSLAAIVFLMLWLYFCMNIFLYGAQINKMIENRNSLK